MSTCVHARRCRCCRFRTSPGETERQSQMVLSRSVNRPLVSRPATRPGITGRAGWSRSAGGGRGRDRGIVLQVSPFASARCAARHQRAGRVACHNQSAACAAVVVDRRDRRQLPRCRQLERRHAATGYCGQGGDVRFRLQHQHQRRHADDGEQLDLFRHDGFHALRRRDHVCRGRRRESAVRPPARSRSRTISAAPWRCSRPAPDR